MILVTGAGGKTGRAVLRALAGRGVPARAWVRRHEQEPEALAAGAAAAVVGDLLDESAARRAVAGVAAIYHICPNVHPEEEAIGRLLIQAAVRAGVDRFVFHSVLHPAIEAMPHHWRKFRVEERLRASGLPFAILQPTAYMQNLLANRRRILEEGALAVPYSIEARISLVDLADVAEAAARVLAGDGLLGEVYPLCAEPAPTHAEIASLLTRILGRPVRAIEEDPAAWRGRAMAAGLDRERCQTLLAMFRYYDSHGMVGESRTLRALLGRPPRSLEEVLREAFGQGGTHTREAAL